MTHTPLIFSGEHVRGEELEREGHYEGIGVEFTILQDTAYLHKIIPGSPADRAGLKPGDAILSIDTNIISGRQRAYADILRIIPDHPSTEFHPSPIFLWLPKDQSLCA